MKYLILLIMLLLVTACEANTEEPMNEIIPEDNSLEVPPREEPEVYFCEDTDEGIDILNKGVVTSDQGVFADTCQDNFKLREYHCEGNTADSSERRCAQGPCVEGACTVIEADENGCRDSDGGSFYEVYGFVNDLNNQTYEDKCEKGLIYEAYCDSFGYGKYKTKNCDVCEEGVCIEEFIEQKFSTCSDSDGGVVYDVKGETVDQNNKEFTDVCLTDKLLEEGYCDTYGLVNSKTTRCLCEEGACVGEI